MMNLFMVLIPFLVSMAVFTHLAVVDFPFLLRILSDEIPDKRLDVSIVIAAEGFRWWGPRRNWI